MIPKTPNLTNLKKKSIGVFFFLFLFWGQFCDVAKIAMIHRKHLAKVGHKLLHMKVKCLKHYKKKIGYIIEIFIEEIW